MVELVGKEDLATQPLALRLCVGKWGGKVGPKDSNAAVGVRSRATGKVPEEYGRQKTFYKL